MFSNGLRDGPIIILALILKLHLVRYATLQL